MTERGKKSATWSTRTIAAKKIASAGKKTPPRLTLSINALAPSKNLFPKSGAHGEKKSKRTPKTRKKGRKKKKPIPFKTNRPQNI